MSRQILFRAKVLHPDPMTNPESGWVEGFYYQDLVNGEVRHFIKNCPCDWEIDPETLGQATGLLDRNGTMIFENDIVRIISDFGLDEIGVVEYRNGGFCVVYDFYGETIRLLLQTKDEYQEMGATIPIKYEFEVIDNIFDNQDLLK